MQQTASNKQRNIHKILLLVILLTAAAIRIIGINNGSPPGLEHDEVANWLIDQSILEGNHAVYFTEAYGHEAGFHYWQTLFVRLIGDNSLALRLPAALMGLLVVAITYTLNRKLFGRDFALLATALSAVLFTAVFYSRLGLRAITLPFTAGISAYYFLTYFDHTKTKPFSFPPSTLRSLLLAALWGGLSTYTYLASRALPFFYGLFFLYLLVFHWAEAKKRWLDGLVFTAVYAITSYPLFHFLQNNPTAEFRVGEVNFPLNSLLEGNPQPVVQNLWKIFLGFGFVGDPLWRQNVAGMPIFEAVGAIGFYAGILFLLIYHRNIHYTFVSLWISSAVIPSLVTIDAPSTIRMILWLPFLATVTALGWWHLLLGFAHFWRKPVNSEKPHLSRVIHKTTRLSTAFPQLSTVFWKNWGITILTLLILVFYFGRTYQATFTTWPESKEVRFVWQATLTEMGQFLDKNQQISDATIVGWTPDTMDAPTMALSMHHSDAKLRHVGLVGVPRTAVLTPNGTLFHPNDLPLHNALAEQINQWGGESAVVDSFTYYTLPSTLQPTPQHSADELFSQELRWLGYDQLTPCNEGECLIRTFWRVEKVPAHGRRFFLHALGEDGIPVAQDDSLHAPARFWQSGDILVHIHTLSTDPAVPISEWRLGVYDPTPPYARLTTDSGQDSVILDID